MTKIMDMIKIGELLLKLYESVIRLIGYIVKLSLITITQRESRRNSHDTIHS